MASRDAMPRRRRCGRQSAHAARERRRRIATASFPHRLKSCTKEFGPLDKLWTCAKEWVEQSHAWHELPLPQVDAEAAASKAGRIRQSISARQQSPREEGRSPGERRAVLQAAAPRDEVLRRRRGALMLLVCEPGHETEALGRDQGDHEARIFSDIRHEHDAAHGHRAESLMQSRRWRPGAAQNGPRRARRGRSRTRSYAIDTTRLRPTRRWVVFAAMASTRGAPHTHTPRRAVDATPTQVHLKNLCGRQQGGRMRRL